MNHNFRIMPVNKKVVLGDNQRFHYSSEHGKSQEEILCPFCNMKTRAYTWSLSGGGKKCDHCKDTLHTTVYSGMRFKTEAEASAKLKELKEKEDV